MACCKVRCSKSTARSIVGRDHRTISEEHESSPSDSSGRLSVGKEPFYSSSVVENVCRIPPLRWSHRICRSSALRKAASTHRRPGAGPGRVRPPLHKIQRGFYLKLFFGKIDWNLSLYGNWDTRPPLNLIRQRLRYERTGLSLHVWEPVSDDCELSVVLAPAFADGSPASAHATKVSSPLLPRSAPTSCSATSRRAILRPAAPDARLSFSAVRTSNT